MTLELSQDPEIFWNGHDDEWIDISDCNSLMFSPLTGEPKWRAIGSTAAALARYQGERDAK